MGACWLSGEEGCQMEITITDGLVKNPTSALVRFFRNSTYYLYSLVPEKPLRLEFELFTKPSKLDFYKFIIA